MLARITESEEGRSSERELGSGILQSVGSSLLKPHEDRLIRQETGAAFQEMFYVNEAAFPENSKTEVISTF